MTIDNLFDVTCENAHMVKVDSFEAAMLQPTVKISTVTPRQLGYLKDLFAARKGNAEAMIIREHLLSELAAGNLSVRMASEAIDDIKQIPVDAQPLPQTFGQIGQSTALAAANGDIWITTSGKIVRIKESQNTGMLYGLVWDGREWNYDLARQLRVMHDLDHIMTAEEAAAFGHEHQWCVFCSRPLSDPRSEFAGYGETCARNRNLPWGATAPVEETESLASTEELVEPVYPPYSGTYRQTNELIDTPTTEDVVEYPYGTGTCYICHQPRPFVLNGFLRGCNC